MFRTLLIHRLAKPAVHVLCLAPLVWLAWRGFSGDLGANPIEAINRFLGDWALRFLLIALAVTPLRGIFGLNELARFRRMLGLYAFAYVSLHLTNYIAVDQFFDWGEIWKDIVKRTFITVGMIAFILLIPLAVTSTKGMSKRLGGLRWQKLHQVVYGVGVLGVVHFYMMVKADVREPLIYAAILAFLLGWRVVKRFPRNGASRKREKKKSLPDGQVGAASL